MCTTDNENVGLSPMILLVFSVQSDEYGDGLLFEPPQLIRRGKNLVFFADLLEQEGETWEEVSKSLGVSKQCAHVLKSRVKKRLMDEVVRILGSRSQSSIAKWVGKQSLPTPICQSPKTQACGTRWSWLIRPIGHVIDPRYERSDPNTKSRRTTSSRNDRTLTTCCRNGCCVRAY